MKKIKNILVLFLFLGSIILTAQETLPIYSDYLSDNVFLVHPSAAGIGNCGKARLTARTQWAGVEDAPALQTLSVHNRIGEKSGIGAIFFNDKNGWHSQTGISGTFAYHIDMGRFEDANQLSFGITGTVLESRIDESNFQIQDPTITYINQSKIYFNADISVAYHFKGLFAYLTARNLLPSPRNLYRDGVELTNIRRFVGTLGYYFSGENESSIQLEPSVMAQVIEKTGEKFADFNLKVYKNVADAKLWAAFSYRQGFDGNKVEELKYITPIIGINYKSYMFSYTYTKQSGDVLFDDAGYHQITLGMNFGCRTPRAVGCPNINASF